MTPPHPSQTACESPQIFSAIAPPDVISALPPCCFAASAAGLTTLQPGQGYKIFVNNTGTLLWVDVA